MPHEEKKPCIFLVDDNPAYLSTGKAVLSGKYTAVTIPSGEKLLPMLQRTAPALILLDVQMPGMSGYDVMEKIKQNPQTAGIPVIFLTGRDEPEDEIRGLSLGAVDYITKPFSAPLLLKRIELHLQLQAQKNELRSFNENLVAMVNDRTSDIAMLQNAIIRWAAEMVEFRDEETGQHVERVQKYLEILLEGMRKKGAYARELDSWDIEAFIKSAPLHDVGKIKISDGILLKASRLSDEEFEQMKLHTVYGKMLLQSLQDKVPDQAFLDFAKTLACSHHEKWDGTGYPEKLKGENIPLQARMMALADVYDALVSERPYKKAFSHEEALEIIAGGRGTQFDPDLADLFIELSGSINDISANARHEKN